MDSKGESSMAFRVRNSILALLAVACLSACVAINSMTPDPAAPGDVLRLHLSNVIGPMSVEPGATATWNVAGSVGHWGESAVLTLDVDIRVRA